MTEVLSDVFCLECGAENADQKKITKLERILHKLKLSNSTRCHLCGALTKTYQTKRGRSLLFIAGLGLCVLGLLFYLVNLRSSDDQLSSQKVEQASVDKRSATKLESQLKAQKTSTIIADQKVALEVTNAKIAEQLAQIEQSKKLQQELTQTVKSLRGELAQTSEKLSNSHARIEALKQQEQMIDQKIGQAIAGADQGVSKLSLDTSTESKPKPKESLNELASDTPEANPESFTIQLASLESFADVQRFIGSLERSSEMTQPFYYYLSKKQTKPWYPILYGTYATREAAVQQIAKLPKSLRARKPLARQIKANSEPMIRYE